MQYQTESKPQCWRAVAVFDDGRYEQLLYLNRSSTQVRAGLREAFMEVLDDEERTHVKAIALQRWHGAPDSGRWMHQQNLPLPIDRPTIPMQEALPGMQEAVAGMVGLKEPVVEMQEETALPQEEVVAFNLTSLAG